MNTEMAGLERQLKVLSDKMVSLRKNEAGVVKSCGEIAKSTRHGSKVFTNRYG